MDQKEKYKEKQYLNWGFVYGLWLMIISYPIAWLLGIGLSASDGALHAFMGISPRINIVIGLLLPLFLFFALKKTDKILPNMDKYGVAIYMLVCIWGLQVIIQSILQWQVVLGAIGMFQIAGAFIVAGVYKTTNHRFRRKNSLDKVE